MFRLRLLFALSWSFLLPAANWAAAPPIATTALIEDLVNVAWIDVEYTPYPGEQTFLVFDQRRGRAHHVRDLGLSPPSKTMRALVKRGTHAVPHLLAHLGDNRPSKVVLNLDFDFYLLDRADRNERTAQSPRALRRPDHLLRPTSAPYTVTVGDLCFVVLGQIVNRNYAVVVHQELGVISFPSPTKSAILRKALLEEWAGLTPVRHKERLIDDFLRPDHQDRRTGAAQRLAYYYPDALAPLVARFLRQPTYPYYEAVDLVLDKLYPARNAGLCRARFNAFINKHGPAGRVAVRVALFADLERRELKGDSRWPPRRLLVELYGLSPTVRSSDRRRYVDACDDMEKCFFIHHALRYDQSPLIDEAVRRLLVSIRDDDALALACMERLVGRGYDADLERYCRRRLRGQVDPIWRGELESMIDKLGRTRLHVAAERDDRATARKLLADGAKVDALARNGQAPLHLAAGQGHLEMVRLLLTTRPHLDRLDASGDTAAQLAAHSGHGKVADLLVSAGCAVTDVFVAAAAGKADRVAAFLKRGPKLLDDSHDSRLALGLAVRGDHAKVVEVLLAHKVAVEEGEGRHPPLRVAIELGHEATARVLLAHKADVRAVTKEDNHDEYQGIHLAALRDHPRLIDLLLAHKADVDAPSCRDRDTPLHLAAEVGNVEVVKRLLRAGARVDARNKEGSTPLAHAARQGHEGVARVLLAHKASPSAVPLSRVARAGRTELLALLLGPRPAREILNAALHQAASAGQRATVQFLLERGADVDARGENRETPLHAAARGGHEGTARLLLDYLADARRTSANEETALHFAAEGGSEALVRLFLAQRADLRAKTRAEGEHPLHRAARFGRVEVMRLLLDRGADVAARTAGQFTALHLAAGRGDEEMARFLLERKASARAVTKTGWGPLQEAAKCQHSDLVELLLDHKAGVDAREKGQGRTALHLAVENDDLDTVVLLLARKAAVTVKDNEGRTPLQIAREKKFVALAELLREHGAESPP